MIIHIILIIISFLILVFSLQDILLFRTFNYTTDGIPTKGSHPDLCIEEIKYNGYDGKPLRGWYIKNKNSLGIFIFFHGNTGNISSWLHFAKRFYKWGYSIFMVEYRGYGICPGVPTETNLYEDALSTYNYITDVLNYAPNNIIIYGKSLGGAVGINLAKKVPASSVVVDSSFTSMPEMASQIIPFGYFICKYKFDSINDIKKITTPILIIHSKNDEIIPFEMGRRLFEYAGSNKQNINKKFLESEGDHNNTKWDDTLTHNIKQFCLENKKLNF